MELYFISDAGDANYTRYQCVKNDFKTSPEGKEDVGKQLRIKVCEAGF